MCGIVGAMSCVLSKNESDAFRDLLNVASLRGRDGSGVIIAAENPKRRFGPPDVRTLKSRLISGWLAYSEDLDKLLNQNVVIAVGHARWPTKGGNEVKAIHPHRSGHIVGVHNGTMWEVCDKKIEDGQSDSALLIKSIAEKGIEETWKTSSGAAAIVWIDEKEQTINFIRNSGRPLMFRNYGWQRNISTMFWASETEMLNFVLPRHFHGTNYWTTFLPENVHFAYPLEPENVIRPCRSEKIERPIVRTSATNIPYEEWWARNEVDPNEDVIVPFKDIAPRFIHSETASQRTAQERAAAAKTRLAEKVDQARKERIEKEKRLGIGPVTTQDGVETGEAKRHSPSAPPFHMHGRAGQSALFPDAVINLPDQSEHTARLQKILNDDIPDFGASREFASLSGHRCCWCGDLAGAGDKVFPIYNTDMGAKEFLCVDCVRNPDTQDFLSKDQTHVIVT